MPVYNQSRSRVIQLIFVAVFIVITAQLLNLQLFSSEYKIQAENNAIYRKVVYPDRGIIYDRKMRAILENKRLYMQSLWLFENISINLSKNII